MADKPRELAVTVNSELENMIFKHNPDIGNWPKDVEIKFIEKQAYDKAMFERNAWYEKYREAMGDVATDHILKTLGVLDDYDPTPSDHKTGAGC